MSDFGKFISILLKKIDVRTSAVAIVIWAIVFAVLLLNGKWNFDQLDQKILLGVFAIGLVGLSLLIALGAVSICSRVWAKLEEEEDKSRTHSNLRDAVASMTIFQHSLIACFVEASEREIRMRDLYRAFSKRLASDQVVNAATFFSQALHSLEDTAFISGHKFLDDNLQFFETLDRDLFDFVVGHPEAVSAKAPPRKIVRKNV
jgi:hypothetical protein